MDAECRTLNAERKRLHGHLRALPPSSPRQSHARSAFMRARSAFTSALGRSKARARRFLFHDIERNQGNSKLFWRHSNNLKSRLANPKAPPDMVQDSEGVVHTDLPAVLRTWRKYTEDLANPSAGVTGDPETNPIVALRLDILNTRRGDDTALSAPFSPREVFQAIRRMHMGTAPGLDGVPSDIIRLAGGAVNTGKFDADNSFVSSLALLFNFALEREVWASPWAEGVQSPLHKGGSRLLPTNYRPITLLSNIGKLFAGILNHRVTNKTELLGLLSDLQGGFRVGRGTPDQTFLLHETLAHRRELGLSTVVMFIDVRKAYDTVWREAAYVAIHDLGIRGKIWRQLQVMHRRLRRRVRLRKGCTSAFDVSLGVAQGAVESPWMYACFIDGLVRELRKRGLGVFVGARQLPCLLYADDIVLLARSIPELQQMATVAAEFARKFRFSFNGEKSGVMVFAHGKGKKAFVERVRQHPWALQDQSIEVVNTYKYLVLDFHTGAGWTTYFRRVLKKARKHSNELAWLCRGLCPRSAATMWKALVRPVLEYGAETWYGSVNKSLIDEAEAIQTSFARAILRLPPGSPNVFVRAELGLERLTSRWRKLRLGYWRKLWVAHPSRALSYVATLRRRDTLAGRSAGSWMSHTRRVLLGTGLGEYWAHPSRSIELSRIEWKALTHRKSNDAEMTTLR